MTKDEWKDEFGSNLKSLMHETRLSSSDLAEAIGVSKSSIEKYLSGDRIPTATVIINMAYELGCDLDDLIDFGQQIE